MNSLIRLLIRYGPTLLPILLDLFKAAKKRPALASVTVAGALAAALIVGQPVVETVKHAAVDNLSTTAAVVISTDAKNAPVPSVRPKRTVQKPDVRKNRTLELDNTWTNIEKITSEKSFRTMAARGRKRLGLPPKPGDEELLKNDDAIEKH